MFQPSFIPEFAFPVAKSPPQILDFSVTSCTGRLFLLPAAFVFHMISDLTPIPADTPNSAHSPEERPVIHLPTLYSGPLSESTSPLSPMLAITSLSLWSVDIYFLWK